MDELTRVVHGILRRQLLLHLHLATSHAALVHPLMAGEQVLGPPLTADLVPNDMSPIVDRPPAAWFFVRVGIREPKYLYVTTVITGGSVRLEICGTEQGPRACRASLDQRLVVKPLLARLVARIIVPADSVAG